MSLTSISKNVCPQCIDMPDYIKEVKKEDIVVSCEHGRYWIKTDKFYTWNCCRQEKDDR